MLRTVAAWIAMLLAGCAPPLTPHEILVADPIGGAVLSYDGLTGRHLGAVLTADHLPPDEARAGFEPADVVVVDGFVLVAEFCTGAVHAFEQEDFSYRQEVYQDRRVLEEPSSLAVDGEDLLVLGSDTSNVLRLSSDGAMVVAGPQSSPSLQRPHAIARSGHLLFVGTGPADRSLDRIQVWDLDDDTWAGSFGVQGEVEDVVGLAVSDDHRLAAVDWSGQVLIYDLITWELLQVHDQDLVAPRSADWAPDGALLVLDELGVARIDELGTTRLVPNHLMQWPRGVRVVTPGL